MTDSSAQVTRGKASDKEDSGSAANQPEKRKSDLVAFRMPLEQRQVIESAAEAVGETLSEFIRNAVLDRLDSEGFWAQLKVTPGRGEFMTSEWASYSITHAATPDVPDFPPRFTNVIHQPKLL